MKAFRFLDRRLGSLGLAVAMLLVSAAPAALLSSSASANQYTARAMTLSNANQSATGVTYTLTFTSDVVRASGHAMVIDFCNDSPVMGETCTAPAGMAGPSASTPSGVVADSASSWRIPSISIASGTNTFTFTGVTNPNYYTTADTNGGFYARIHVYANNAAATAGGRTAAAPGAVIDNGGIAMAITQPLIVNAVIRETMTFCVTAATPTSACGNATTAPTVSLGEGSPKALTTTDTSTGTVTSQISTNASGGAIVRMKLGSNTCGGLQRAGNTSTCEIPPVATGTDAIAAGTAKFGMRLGTVAAAGTGSGTINKATNYQGTSNAYGLNYVSGGASGVTSTSGDEIYNSNAAPVSNQNVPLIFGAAAGPTTPAGSYTATFSLIATGTF